MKNLFASLLAVLVFAAFASAGTFVAPTMEESVIDFGGIHKKISGENKYCTLTTSNTKTIVNNTKIDGGWNYVLVHDTLTGSSAASAVIEVVLAALDENGKTLYTKIVDSILGSAEQYGGQCEIPYYKEVCGPNFKLYLQGDTGAETIINRIYLMKWRPMQWNKDWK